MWHPFGEFCYVAVIVFLEMKVETSQERGNKDTRNITINQNKTTAATKTILLITLGQK